MTTDYAAENLQYHENSNSFDRRHIDENVIVDLSTTTTRNTKPSTGMCTKESSDEVWNPAFTEPETKTYSDRVTEGQMYIHPLITSGLFEDRNEIGETLVEKPNSDSGTADNSCYQTWNNSTSTKSEYSDIDIDNKGMVKTGIQMYVAFFCSLP